MWLRTHGTWNVYSEALHCFSSQLCPNQKFHQVKNFMEKAKKVLKVVQHWLLLLLYKLVMQELVGFTNVIFVSSPNLTLLMFRAIRCQTTTTWYNMTENNKHILSVQLTPWDGSFQSLTRHFVASTRVASD